MESSHCWLIEIGDNVFIGAGSIVLPNVSIGENSIIDTGSIVTKDVPFNVVCVGNPATIITSVEEFVGKNRAIMKNCPVYFEEYTLRSNISELKKIQQREQLENTIGYVV